MKEASSIARANEPKYSQVKTEILARIQSGQLKPGDRLPSEAELMAEFGVSRHTIRQAIGDLETEGWLDRRHGSGTYVRQQPGAGRRAALVGVITTHISEYIFPSIIRGIERYLSERDYGVILLSTDNRREREPDCIKMAIGHNVSGLIIEPSQSALPNPDLAPYRELEDRGIPFVMINGVHPGLTAPAVTLDDAAGVCRLVEHLTQLGHREIAAIIKSDDMQGLERERGMLEALGHHGITPRTEWICRYTSAERESRPAEFVQQLVSQQRRPTALLCYNDQIALQVLPVLKRAGLRVPEDISVVGYDDASLLASADVQLTTVAHPQEEMGAKAAELLCEQMSGQASSRYSVHYLPRVVVRLSTGPAAESPHFG